MNNQTFFEMDKHFFLQPDLSNLTAIKDDPDKIKNELIINEFVNDYKAHTDVWEPNTTKLVKDIVKQGNQVIDIGASIGYFTLLLSRQVGPTGKVYAIEPTKHQFPYLLTNIEKNGYADRVEAHNVGAWDKETMLEFPKVATNRFYVQAIPIDKIVKSPIDFIKIDTDGSEPQVLRGLRRTIENSPNLKMVIEWYPEYIEKAGGKPQEVLDFLAKYFTYEAIPGDNAGSCQNFYCKRK